MAATRQICDGFSGLNHIKKIIKLVPTDTEQRRGHQEAMIAGETTGEKLKSWEMSLSWN